MKNVLFITESYHYAPSPNGNCVERVANELLKNGNSVVVATLRNQYIHENETLNNIDIYRIPSYLEWQLLYNKSLPAFVRKIGSHIIRALKYVMNPWHPLRSLGVYYNMLSLCKNLIKKHKIDTIVAVHRDFETMLAGVKLKKLYPDLKLIVYCLDAISGGVCSNPTISERAHIKKCFAWEKRILKICDCFCVMNSHREWLSQKQYDIFRDKIVYEDVPTLSLDNYSVQSKNDNEIRFTFTGMLSETNADWSFFLGVLPYMAKQRKLRVDVYGGMSKGIEDGLNMSGLRDKIVFFHGRVSQTELLEVRKNSDVFLNFGNEHSCGIPCKIFEYLGTGRMILSFYKIDNDASKPYLEKYTKALVLREEKGLEQEYAHKILEFIDANAEIAVSREMIESLYYKNTPKAMSDLIERI